MMRKTLIAAFIAIFIAAPLFAEDRDEGRDIFDTICSICHQRPVPESLKMSQWKVVLKTMRKRMEQKDMAPLSEHEEELVLEYLKKHARD